MKNRATRRKLFEIRQDARHGDVRRRLVDPFLGAWLEEVQKHGP
jgi:hypothetical protein